METMWPERERPQEAGQIRCSMGILVNWEFADVPHLYVLMPEAAGAGMMFTVLADVEPLHSPRGKPAVYVPVGICVRSITVL